MRLRRCTKLLTITLAVLMVMTSIPWTTLNVYADDVSEREESVSGSEDMGIITVSEDLEDVTESAGIEDTVDDGDRADIMEPEEATDPEDSVEPEETDDYTDMAELPAMEDANSEDRLGDEEDTEETVTFVIHTDDHVKAYLYNESDPKGRDTFIKENEITTLEVPKGAQYTPAFWVKADSGYTIRSRSATTTIDGKKMGMQFMRYGKGGHSQAAYQLSIRKGMSAITEGGEINLRSALIQDQTATISYPKDRVDVKVAIEGVNYEVAKTVTPTADGKVTVSNIDYLIIKVKSKGDYLVRVNCISAENGVDEMYAEEDLENGYTVYYLPKMYEDFTVEVTAKESATVNFKTDHASLERVSVFQDGDTVSYDSTGDEIEGNAKIRVEEGTPVYFRLSGRANIGTLQIGTIEGKGTETVFKPLEPVGLLDPDQNNDYNKIYQVIPTKDQDITVMAKVAPHVIPITWFEKDCEVVEYYGMPQEDDDFVDSSLIVSPDFTYVKIWENVDFDFTLKSKSGEVVKASYKYLDGVDAEGNTILSKKKLGYSGDPAEDGQLFMVVLNAKMTELFIGTDPAETDLNPYAITVDTKSDKLSYVMVTNDEVKKDSSAADRYTVEKEAKGISFTVTAKENGITPYVKAKVEAGEVGGSMTYTRIKMAIEKGTDSEGNAAYTYTIGSEYITDNIQIEILENPGPQKFTVKYNIPDIKVTLKVDGKEIQPTEVTPGELGKATLADYLVEPGKEVEYSIAGNTKFTVKNILYKNNNGKTLERLGKASQGSFLEEEDSYLEITVNAENQVTVNRVIRNSEGEVVREVPMFSEKDTFTVFSGSEYEYALRMYWGGYNISRYLQVRSGKEMLEYDYDLDAVRFTVTSNRAFSFRLIATLDFFENHKITKISKFIKFIIGSEINAVSLSADGSAGGTPEIWADTVNAVKVYNKNPEGAVTGIGYEIQYEPGVTRDDVSVEWIAGRRNYGAFKVRVNSGVPEGKAAVIKLYRNYKEPDKADYYISESDGGVIPIIVTRPTRFEEEKPETALVEVDDLSFLISLKGLEKFGANIQGARYYKVKVTPKAKDGEPVPENIKNMVERPFYFAKEEWDGEDLEEEVIQTELIKVIQAEKGRGFEYEFDVAVSMIWVKDKNIALTAENEKDMVLYESQAATGTYKTKQPIYASKITLGKKNTKIYTTQEEVVAAIIGFDAAALMKKAAAEDITGCEDSAKLQVRVSDDQLIVSASENTALGKHTIQVIPEGAPSVYKAPVTMDITVQKGIETLKVNIPSGRLYKKSGGTGGMTATVLFNENDTAPASKKVQWSLVDTYGDPLDEELLKVISISSSGKVTVSNKWNSDEYESSFCVKASANDFVGNTVTAVSPKITITSAAIVPGELMIVKYNSVTGYYDVLARNGDSVTTGQLEEARLVAFPAYVIEEDDEGTKQVKLDLKGIKYFTESELQRMQILSDYYTASTSSKFVTITKAGNANVLSASKIGKNIKLTVKTTDGGGKSASMKFNIKYAVPSEMDFIVYQGKDKLTDLNTDKANVGFYGTVNTVLEVRLMEKNSAGSWSELTAYTDHKVSIKGGKILSSDPENGIYRIIVTSAQATVTMNDKANKNTKTCVLSNLAYSDQKAPQVKVNTGSSNKIKSGSADGRTVEYAIPSGYSHVMVEMDAAANVKAGDKYAAFANAATPKIGTCVEVVNGILKLEFDSTDIAVEKYKMTFTLGSIRDGRFIAGAKPISQTIQAAKPKATKGSYKPQTTYKIDALPGTEVTLTGKESNVVGQVKYTELLSCNVKGRENKFLEYFELGEGNVLALKPSLSPGQLEALKANKDDRTGYVSYTVSYGDDGYGNPYETVTKTVKITININK